MMDGRSRARASLKRNTPRCYILTGGGGSQCDRSCFGWNLPSQRSPSARRRYFRGGEKAAEYFRFLPVEVRTDSGLVMKKCSTSVNDWCLILIMWWPAKSEASDPHLLGQHVLVSLWRKLAELGNCDLSEIFQKREKLRKVPPEVKMKTRGKYCKI